MEENSMTLDEMRKEIDEIDQKLLPLFMARMDCAKQVAAIKKEQNLPVFNAQREQEILDRAAGNAGDYGGEARILYTAMMETSRALQHDLLGSGGELRARIANADTAPQKAGKIACLGEIGSFSHEALLHLYPQAQPQFHPSFGEIFAAVENGKADLGLLPVENSSAGSVSEVYDFILKYRFYIAAASTLRVNHCLTAEKQTTLDSISTVYSHPQPLAQCSDFLSRSKLHTQACSSTTEAARLVAEKKNSALAAICSAHAANEYGLHILERDIQNSANNRTRFIAISRRLFIPTDAQKISLCFSLPHQTGSLYSVLARFAAVGLSLTKIESRPIAGRNFEYDFYLDFTGNVHEKRTLNLLCALSGELPRFTFLGNYLEEE
jgi:chorismate mutase/prephenate dehydratase